MNFHIKDKDGKDVQETIKADRKKRLTEVDVKGDGKDFKLINDFARVSVNYVVSPIIVSNVYKFRS